MARKVKAKPVQNAGPAGVHLTKTSTLKRGYHEVLHDRDVYVDQIAIVATQYEFYLPISVWHLQATKDFLASLSQLAGGATVFKEDTGVWRETREKRTANH